MILHSQLNNSTTQQINLSIINYTITDLIPQRPPFVMVDRLVYYESEKATTHLLVQNDNLFCEKGVLQAAGLVENIAQTCAAKIGYANRCCNEAVKVGVIGAIRNLNVYRCPAVGELLETTIVVKEEVFQMTLVDAVVKSGEEVLVEAQMKIALVN